MSVRAVNQNNLIAGSFVIGGILLAVAISFILGDISGKFGTKSEYIINFPPAVGVAGLQPGAEITFAGMPVGQVTSVKRHTQPNQDGTQIPDAMYVHIKLDTNLVLYENAIADLAPPLLGGISKINIASAGTGPSQWSNDPNDILDQGEMLQGRFSPSILRQIGFTAEETQKILDMIDKIPAWSDRITEVTQDASDITGRVSNMAEKLEPEFIQSVDDGRTTIQNITLFTDKLHGDDGWSSKIDSVISSTKDASESFKPAIQEARDTLAAVKGAVDENRENIGSITENIKEITHSVRFETIDKANTLLENGTLAVGSFNNTVKDIKGVINDNRANINTTMINARQLSLSGKLFLDEIRFQPWRLLKKPSKSDLKREPLYEAARAYANAVSELKAASQSLDSTVQTLGNNEDSTSEEFAVELLRLASVVDQAYNRYENAERGLLDLLSQSP